jgi:hypothetical protein
MLTILRQIVSRTVIPAIKSYTHLLLFWIFKQHWNLSEILYPPKKLGLSFLDWFRLFCNLALVVQIGTVKCLWDSACCIVPHSCCFVLRVCPSPYPLLHTHTPSRLQLIPYHCPLSYPPPRWMQIFVGRRRHYKVPKCFLAPSLHNSFDTNFDLNLTGMGFIRNALFNP